MKRLIQLWWRTQWALIMLCLFGIFPRAGAATGVTPAQRELQEADQILRDKSFKVAQTRLEEFVARHPDSSLKPEAFLFLSRAIYSQSNYTAAVQVLSNNLAQAGPLSDQYNYWIGVISYQQGEFKRALEAFDDLVSGYPLSPRRLEGCYLQALCYSRLDPPQWRKLIDLLSVPQGNFRLAVKHEPDNPFGQEGVLLLAEAYLHEGDLSAVLPVLLNELPGSLPPDLMWRRQYTIGRLGLAQREPLKVLEGSTNLLILATNTGSILDIADTLFLQGQALENAGKKNEAIEIYERNLAENLPPDVRRKAWVKSLELAVAQNHGLATEQKLQTFIGSHTNDPNADLILFTLGELKLQDHARRGETVENTSTNGVRTNSLAEATGYFDQVLNGYTNSSLWAQAESDRGWCDWETENYASAADRFRTAVPRLGNGGQALRARFKLADALFKLGDFSGAISNYVTVLDLHGVGREDGLELRPEAHYQIVRAAILSTNQDLATLHLKRLLSEFPDAALSEHGLLLTGVALSQKGRSMEALRLFEDFMAKYPDSKLAPEVRLAIARNFDHAGDWKLATDAYAKWMADYPQSPLLPGADFLQGLALEKSGLETNSFQLFTNFVQRFPANPLTPLARKWIADYYYNHEEYANADRQYQLLYQDTNVPPALAYEARFLAGKTAFSSREMKTATNYFFGLVNSLLADTNAPPGLLVKTWFALGDTLGEQFAMSPQKTADDFEQIVNVFTRITKEFPTNGEAALACCRIGDSYLQWAGIQTNAQLYLFASNWYAQALSLPAADSMARGQARFGIGKVYEKLNKIDQALVEYSELVYGQGYDPNWVHAAGLAAAELFVRGNQLEQAIKIYEKMARLFPGLEPVLQKKIASLRKPAEPLR